MDASPKKPLRGLQPYVLLLLAAAGATFVFLWMNRREPIQEWMFWRFGAAYGLTLFFGLSCLVSGHAAVGLLVRADPLPLRERLLFDFTAGVVLFALAVFLVGICHGLGAVSFFALPVALILAGARAAVRDLRRTVPRVRAHLRRARQAPALFAALAIGFGAIGLLLAYLPLLTAQNVSFDARWYHLGIAEHYAAAGAIGRFPEGFYLGAYPHLASWLYTWVWTAPFFDLHARILLAAHLEFLLFIATLASVPVLVARLVPGPRVRGAWAAMFLFPGMFLYDSNLIVGADHVLAFFAVPLALSTLRFLRQPTAGRGALFGLAMAGAALTKAQAIYMLVPAGVAVVVAVGVRLRRGEKLKPLAYVLAVPTAGTFLLLTAAHWLANTLWHRNPVYPFLADFFPSRPWRTVLGGLSPDSGWTPEGPLLSRIGETLASPFTFAFVPHDWETFHHDIPVFGFLFTLSLAFLPFLRGTRRVWLLSGATLVGVAIWFWTFHQDRYLQSLLPWMAAVTAALFALAWRTGVAARVGVAGLVGAQLIAGGDTPFLPTHAMAGGSPVEIAVRLLSSTFRKDYAAPRNPHSGFEGVRRALPTDAKVLYHLDYIRLGIGRPVATDNPRWSGGPLLGFMDGPAAAIAHLRSLGVTHLLHQRDNCRFGDLNLQSELAFHTLAERFTEDRRDVDGWKIDQLPATVGEDRFGDVLYAGCGQRGKLPFSRMDNAWEEDRRASPGDTSRLPPGDESLFDGAIAVVMDDRCSIAFPPGAQDRFVRATHWREATIWIRKRGQ